MCFAVEARRSAGRKALFFVVNTYFLAPQHPAAFTACLCGQPRSALPYQLARAWNLAGSPKLTVGQLRVMNLPGP